MRRILRSELRVADQWTHDYVHAEFRYKDGEVEINDSFADNNPSNRFRILGVALHHPISILQLQYIAAELCGNTYVHYQPLIQFRTLDYF